mmetsp:Transcript_25039/g.72433  ORF Transcript_25039/g.72433 Transcript_25039/m.72433 type:complete len:209 (+) Transcript_25039:41-667(+)
MTKKCKLGILLLLHAPLLSITTLAQQPKLVMLRNGRDPITDDELCVAAEACHKGSCSMLTAGSALKLSRCHHRISEAQWWWADQLQITANRILDAQAIGIEVEMTHGAIITDNILSRTQYSAIVQFSGVQYIHVELFGSFDQKQSLHRDTSMRKPRAIKAGVGPRRNNGRVSGRIIAIGGTKRNRAPTFLAGCSSFCLNVGIPSVTAY